jgi:DNA-binding NarL/FixJ family response regulator
MAANEGRPTADEIRSLLTERELEVFKRLASGDSNKAIGQSMLLSENTVKNHVASILGKLKLSNRVQAAAEAVRNGFSCVGVVALAQSLAEEADPLYGGVLAFLFGS